MMDMPDKREVQLITLPLETSCCKRVSAFWLASKPASVREAVIRWVIRIPSICPPRLSAGQTGSVNERV